MPDYSEAINSLEQEIEATRDLTELEDQYPDLKSDADHETFISNLESAINLLREHSNKEEK